MSEGSRCADLENAGFAVRYRGIAPSGTQALVDIDRDSCKGVGGFSESKYLLDTCAPSFSRYHGLITILFLVSALETNS